MTQFLLRVHISFFGKVFGVGRGEGCFFKSTPPRKKTYNSISNSESERSNSARAAVTVSGLSRSTPVILSSSSG